MWCLVLLLAAVSVGNAQFDASTCGVSKACFVPSENNCYQGCNGMRFSYVFLNETNMAIEISGNSDSPTGFYFAVGFSNDDMMGNESVIECSSIGKEAVSLKFSYNEAPTASLVTPTNVRIVNETQFNSYFQNAKATYTDGTVYCRAVVNVGGAPDPRVFKFNPSIPYYLMMANGPTTDTGLSHHVHDVTTQSTVNLVDIRPAFDRNGCGVTKGCYIPSKDECCGQDIDMVVSYLLLNNTHMRMELVSSSNSSTGQYVAVAFGQQRKMINESVIECSSLGNQPLSSKFSYNNAHFTNVRIDGEPAIREQYISDYSTYQDGDLYCTAVIQITGDKDHPEIFKYDPSQEYYLQLAKGKTSHTGLTPHDAACVAKQSISLNQLQPSFDTSSCGSKKNCFLPTECYKGCNGMGFSYKLIADFKMMVEIFSVATAPSYYVALGFSDDNTMGNDYVIECSSIDGNAYSMKYSYNVADEENIYNTRIKGEKYLRSKLIKNETVTFQDGRLYCSATIDVSGSSKNEEIFKYDPSVNYWLLMASGTTNKDGLNKHFDHVVSDTSFNLQTGEPIVPATLAPNEDFDCRKCNVTKGCYFPRGQITCTGMGFAYKYISETEIEMELMRDSSSGYVAVGFSPNGQMGNVPVIECSQLQKASLSMKFSYNNDSPNNVRIPNEQQIESTYFKNPVYKQENGQMYCKATVNVGGWSSSNQVFKYSPGTKYFLLVAEGTTSETAINVHSDKQASAAAVDLASVGTVAGGKKGLDDALRMRLIHAHAVMMILAWVCFVPTAILFARSLRASWPLVKPGGLLIWFHVHRTTNLLGIVLMIASFVCIMCANSWKWTGLGSSSRYWTQVHTMTGLFALIFAWMQPFISFMRCHPNTPNRPIFNWVHRLIGVFAFILATTALSIAAQRFTLWHNPSLQLGLVLIPISLMVLLFILNPLLDILQEKNQNNYPLLEMVRQVVVLVSVGLVAGDAVALCVMVTQ